MWRNHFLPPLVWLLYSLFYKSWRKKLYIEDGVQELIDSKQPVLLAHWHGDELAILHLVKTFELATMTSTSSDGSLIDYVIRKMGGATSRGSSTRGGVQALKGLIRLIKSGRMSSIAVDGPKGPIHKPKPGVFEISRLAQAYIVPVGVSASQAYVFQKSWNKAILPKLFSKVHITFSAPLAPLDKSVSAKSTELAKSLEDRLFDARRQAQGKCFAAARGEC